MPLPAPTAVFFPVPRDQTPHRHTNNAQPVAQWPWRFPWRTGWHRHTQGKRWDQRLSCDALDDGAADMHLRVQFFSTTDAGPEHELAVHCPMQNLNAWSDLSVGCADVG